MRSPWYGRLANNTVHFGMRAVDRIPFGILGVFWFGLVFGYLPVFYFFLGFGFGASLMWERIVARDRETLYTFFWSGQ